MLFLTKHIQQRSMYIHTYILAITYIIKFKQNYYSIKRILLYSNFFPTAYSTSLYGNFTVPKDMVELIQY